MTDAPTVSRRQALAARCPDVLSTAQAALLLMVSQQTVTRSFDAGALKGFRVPGSKFRRVPREALVAFAEAHGIPLPPPLGRAA